MALVAERLPATLELAGFALLFSAILALPIGVLAAVAKGSSMDTAAKIIALLGQSLPGFWLGIVLMWVFAVMLGWLPASGRGGLQHLILPAITLGWFQVAVIMRLVRSSMLEVLDSEFVKLARVKGIPEWKVIWKHCLRNASIAPLTVFAIIAGSLLTGSVVTETVFTWPGVGLLVVDAVRSRDFQVVQAVVILFAGIFILCNLLVDILYAYLDPRIRYQMRDCEEARSCRCKLRHGRCPGTRCRGSSTGGTRIKRYPLLPLAILLFLLVIPAVFAPWIAPHEPFQGSLSNRLTPPVWQDGGTMEHLLGTDKLGRDMLSRIIYGARVSLTVSLIAIFVGGIIGTVLGLISGYFGGRTDAVIMRLVDISLALPTILLALVLVAAVGPSFGTVITVLIVLLWARYARLVRGETLAIKELDFIARARVAGASRDAHHVPVHLPQRGELAHRAGDAPGGIRHPARVRPELPGSGAAARRTGLGRHGR